MIEVNLKNLGSNVKAITKNGKKLIGVVKNNAYGCGAVEVSKYLINCGIQYLFVNDIKEAKVLLENNITTNIIMFNSLNINEYAWLYKNDNLITSINSLEDCLNLNEYCHTNIRVHIQIDTKLNRLGIKNLKEFNEVLKILKNNDKFSIEGIYTHFASAESGAEQVLKFKEYTDLYHFPMIHCSASSTYKSIDFGDYVRVGLDLYDLNQVMSIKALPLVIRDVAIGETIGYNSEYKALENMKIAVLPIGYGNGYRCIFTNFHIFCQGKMYPVVGRICMNHMFVKVDDSVNMESAFEVTSPNLPASELAEYAHISKYEIYTMFRFDEVKYLS
jgi:alanine racemase